jgi:hypothetical protein
MVPQLDACDSQKGIRLERDRFPRCNIPPASADTATQYSESALSNDRLKSPISLVPTVVENPASVYNKDIELRDLNIGPTRNAEAYLP